MAAAQEPADVAIVRRFAASENLARLTRAKAANPNPALPTVISVVRNEMARLPDFFDHHRRLGVRHFVMIDNASDDGSRDWLRRQPDVDLYAAETPFAWRRKHGWITQVIERTGPNRWWLLLDADEHAIFAECEMRTLSDLTAYLDRRRVQRARAALIDMYAKGPVEAMKPEPGLSLAERFPYFDAATYSERQLPELTARTGGPRRRLTASTDPETEPALTKYPLFRLNPGEIAFNPHAIWPPADLADDPCLIGLKHFKFDEGFFEKIAYALETGAYWRDSAEYKAYVAAIEHDPTFSLFFPGSRRYLSSEDFVDTGVITQPEFLEEAATLANQIKRAERKRRADLLAAEKG